ncbi:MAG: nicotinate (nicotinamide) nucleotide adenylyltransferase [Campylobacterales bacterium]|nr:nicotinate (nicotinamide) nucleotide adenylyltransferase [Campylobacterales bacterium]
MIKVSQSIAIFGGSFDPPHLGHQAIVKQATLMLDIDKLIIIPAFLNPFKTSSLATPEQRLQWTRKIFSNFPNVMVDDYEIRQGNATPTAKTVRHFQQDYDVRYLIIGADNLADITKWYEFEWLNHTITWVIATRKGYAVQTEALRAFIVLEIDEDISSTRIRSGAEINPIDSTIQSDVIELLTNQN